MLKAFKKVLKGIMDKRANDGILQWDWVNVEPIENVSSGKAQNIVFIIPPILPSGGGHTSILRIGTHLFSQGCNVTYAVCGAFDEKQQLEAARSCLSSYKGTVAGLDSVKEQEFDVVIATNCFSVYYAQKLKGYKVIFAQDYEPYFYEAGDYSYLARKSYELGFPIISLGGWNKYMIHKHVNDTLPIEVISFPYEKKEYKYVERDYTKYADKNEYNLCVYIRKTPRRLPGTCQMIVKSLQENFQKDGKKLNVYYFGEKDFQYKYGNNLGQLSKEKLFELYCNCDFGMVSSYTNISLVPYEMLATGLPIIEMKGGSFPFFFDEKDAFLFDWNYTSLYNEIKNSIENPQILVERDKRVQSKLSQLSWDTTCREFENVLKQLTKV